jgi:hypothetical protein
MKKDNEESLKFLIESYKDLSQNVMHIEGQMFNHMSFFLTLFIGVLTATIAIIQITRAPNQPISLIETIGVLSLPFLFLHFVGRFEVEMILQLRVRKIKFIEGITRAREYFIKRDLGLTDYIVLPAKLEKAPPYLRVKSEDWWKLCFVVCLNTVSLIIFWCSLPFFINWLIGGTLFTLLLGLLGQTLANCLIWIWAILVLVCCVLFYGLLFYRRIMIDCLRLDTKREVIMGKPSEYDLLSFPSSKYSLRWSLRDWFLLLKDGKCKDG